MKKISRILLFVLLLAIISTAAISCKEKPVGTSTPTTSGTTSDKFELFSNLPDVNYNGEEIVFLVEGDYMGLYQSVEIFENETSPDLINSAVTKRNSQVEEKFGVKISQVTTTAYGDMAEKIRLNQQGGTDLYDIVMPFVPDAAKLSLEGYFYLLNDNKNIHLSESYWDQGSVNGLSINHKNYFAVGDFSLLSLGCTHALVFNKDVITQYQLENPYTLVKDGKWTIDKLHQMSKGITSDSNGTPGMQYDDTYGFLVNNNFAASMFAGSGERFTSKNDEDLPYISVYSERGVDVFGKIFNLVNDKATTGYIESFQDAAIAAGLKSCYQAATQSVATKKVLFRAMAISDIPELGEFECNYGILPIPKYEENQDKYNSFVSTIYTSSAAIPMTNPDFEKAAIILDAVTQASTDTTKYSFYQKLLKERKIQDNESEEMLDIIFGKHELGNRVYDLGAIFGWGDTSPSGANSVYGFMNTIAFSGENTFASKYESIKDSIQAALDKDIQSFKG